MLELDQYQLAAVKKLDSGKILWGSVGSGKSLTALYYYFSQELKCKLEDGIFRLPKKAFTLYIICPAQKRDKLEWDEECRQFYISRGNGVVIDSWNNIAKYTSVENAFFIFDEQRLVGNGTWVKSFLKIAQKNRWILLTATPGDNWLDYIPVFIANGFYKNRTQFLARHVIFNNFKRYRTVNRYVDVKRLIYLRDLITVDLTYTQTGRPIIHRILTEYDKQAYREVNKFRWNIFKNEPITDVTQLGYALREVCNKDVSKLNALADILEKHKKVIVFYNFDYELEMLKTFCGETGFIFAEWNGHNHQPIPESKEWLYLVQYNAGSEGWNCIETNAMIFFSLSYSYKTTLQASGRINRRNTPFKELHYYILTSNSPMDRRIILALSHKKDFNVKKELKF